MFASGMQRNPRSRVTVIASLSPFIMGIPLFLHVCVGLRISAMAEAAVWIIDVSTEPGLKFVEAHHAVVIYVRVLEALPR